MRIVFALFVILSSPAWAQSGVTVPNLAGPYDPQFARDIKNQIIGYAKAKGMSEEELAKSFHFTVKDLESICYSEAKLSGSQDVSDTLDRMERNARR